MWISRASTHTRTGELRARARRAETHAPGRPYPKNTHARSGAKRLLQGRRPENAVTGLWRPPEYLYVGSERKAIEIKKVPRF